MLFIDRTDAGRHLAQRLLWLRDADVVVLGLPRGGVPVAFEVAEELHAPLDVIVVRKLGVPFQPELGFGAIGEGGVRILDDHIVRVSGLTESQVSDVEAEERAQLEHRLRLLRGGRPPVPLTGRTAIVVDDGIATGSTARAACAVARARGASRVVLAVPVCPAGGIPALGPVADEVVCVQSPARFFAIGEWYAEFTQVPDTEVMTLLDKASAARPGPGRGEVAAADPPAIRHEITVDAGGVRLPGWLTVPDKAAGLVVFAHGSGSSRRSPRNQFVAASLNEAGLATVLIDLLARTRSCPVVTCSTWPC